MSPNFGTLIQVQSLFIIGHFLLSFDQITGQPRDMKKILPACASHLSTDCNDSRILPQFNEFVCEWSEFLHLGLTSSFNEEIDPCFWKALGSLNFLQSGEERCQSFQFVSPTAIFKTHEFKLYYCNVFMTDKQELLLCMVESDSYVVPLILVSLNELTDSSDFHHGELKFGSKDGASTTLPSPIYASPEI